MAEWTDNATAKRTFTGDDATPEIVLGIGVRVPVAGIVRGFKQFPIMALEKLARNIQNSGKNASVTASFAKSIQHQSKPTA